MKITPIRNEVDYQNALNRLEIIFDAKKGTEEGDELEILSILIDSYEEMQEQRDAIVEMIKADEEDGLNEKIEMKQSNRDRQREFSYKVVGWSILIFVGFTIFSSLIRLIFH